ncbi:phage tail tape measure protein [Tomitella fengzijianii]|uniref:Phage tail tape measure protein n=1 Tax=Tomitella fengzijianii TaxID=2597660 RepID=A0A516X4I0_9ACTN|nr:phage tail tape measure protein [Tomitella fengzijianii]QDQ97985.1 phage tail tape measure protein [Tomitella fengzijianii]
MPNVGYATLSIIPVAKGIEGKLANAVGPGVKATGLKAGKQMGDAVAQGLDQAKAQVQAASEKLAKARGKEEDTANKVRVAELKLQELRDSGRAKASSIEAAEGRLTKAKRDAKTASDQTAAAEKKLTAANDDLAKASDTTSDKVGLLHKATGKAAGGLGTLGEAMARIPGPIGAAGIGISGMSTKFGELADSSTGALVSKENLGKLAVGATAVAATVGTALYKIGSSFDDVSATIRIGTGATGDELAGLEDVATSIGTTIPVSFGDAADAVTTLSTATGATGDDLEALSTQVLNASRLLGEDAASNAEGFGKVLNQWSMDAGQGADAVDGLFKVTQTYGSSFGNLTNQLNTYGSVLQNAGFSMEDSAVLFGKLEQSGLSVSRIMPGLNKAFRDWASDGKDVKATLQEQVDAIKNAETSTDALAIATEQFGAEGAQRLTTGIRNGSFAIDDLAGSLGDTTGIVAEADQDTRTFAESWQILKNKGLEAIKGPAEKVFGLITTGVNAVADFAGQNEWVADTLKTVGTILLPMVGTFLGIVGAVKAWTIAQAALNVVMSMNPIGLIITALVGLVAGLVLAYKKSETFRNIVQAAWEGIKTAVSAVWNGFLKPVFAAWKVAFKAAGTAATWLWNNAIVPAWNGIKAIISGAWTGVIEPIFDGFKSAIDIVGDAATWLYDNAIKPAWDGISSAIGAVWDFISPIFDKLGAAFGTIGDIASNVGDGIKTAFSGVVGVMKKPLNMLGEVLKKVPRSIFGFDIPGASTIHDWGETLAGLATGGTIGARRDSRGRLTGPGTGTSDSILGVNGRGIPQVRVSTGETVMNKRTSDANPELLAALNAGWVPSPAFLAAMIPGLSRGGVVQAIAQSAADHGMGRQGAVIGTMTGLAESGLRVLANPAVPDSYNYPHDGEGYDHDSIGVFQQRQAGWGTTADRMDPKRSADMFFDALAGVPGWETMDPALAAQAVQRSAFSDGSNYRPHLPEAERLVDQAGDLPDSSEFNGLGPSGDLPGFGDTGADPSTTSGAAATGAAYDESMGQKVYVTNWPSSYSSSTGGTATLAPATGTTSPEATAVDADDTKGPLAQARGFIDDNGEDIAETLAGLGLGITVNNYGPNPVGAWKRAADRRVRKVRLSNR